MKYYGIMQIVSAFLILVCAGLPGCGPSSPIAGDEAAWSAPVNGLRGRLVVLPPATPDRLFCRVFLELQNVHDALGQQSIRYDSERLGVRVTDDSGKELPIAGEIYSGMSPLWKPTLLPFGGTIKFQVSFPGLQCFPRNRVIVDMGPQMSWVIPQDGKTYWLSGRLTIPHVPGDHPYMDWSGTLDLPRVRIPK